MRFYKVINGRFVVTEKREEAQEVMMSVHNLEELERRIQNKTEEADRWRKRVTGEGMEWKITRRLFKSTDSLSWSLYISVPLPHNPDIFEEVNRVSKKYLGNFMERGYTLQYTAGAGWVLGIHLTNAEYNAFRIP